jgi:hypothetical protein
MVDGVAFGPGGERIAIEVKSPRDDIVRGIGQCYEALAWGYTRAVLVTTLRVTKKLRKRVFQRRGIKLVGVDAKARIHRYDPEGWRLLNWIKDSTPALVALGRRITRDPASSLSFLADS